MEWRLVCIAIFLPHFSFSLDIGRGGVWDSPSSQDEWVKKFGFLFGGGRSGVKGMKAIMESIDIKSLPHIYPKVLQIMEDKFDQEGSSKPDYLVIMKLLKEHVKIHQSLKAEKKKKFSSFGLVAARKEVQLEPLVLNNKLDQQESVFFPDKDSSVFFPKNEQKPRKAKTFSRFMAVPPPQ